MRCSKKVLRPTRLYARCGSSPMTVMLYCPWTSRFITFSLCRVLAHGQLTVGPGVENLCILHEGHCYHTQPHHYYVFPLRAIEAVCPAQPICKA